MPSRSLEAARQRTGRTRLVIPSGLLVIGTLRSQTETMVKGDMDAYFLRHKWLPRSGAELLEAFRDGMLEERNWCDVKREVDSNVELARDLASFSVDGGIIVVGIDEKSPDDPLYPVPLKGLCERIEQIARLRVDPPLQVTCTPVSSGTDDGSGYVIARVPASALAPHQVQGIYYGRGDKTRTRLSDAEVARLHRRREEWNQDARELLDHHVAADPFADAQACPHVFFVARPVAGWPEMCRELAGDAEWRGQLRALMHDTGLDESLRALRTRMFPGQPAATFFGGLTQLGKTERGAVLSNRPLPVTALGGDGRFTTTLEISEDGELRFLHVGAGEPRQFNGIQYTGLYPETVALIVRDMLVLARKVSEYTGHAAMWELGLAVTGISGARAVASNQRVFIAMHHEYPGSVYRRTARATVLDLEKVPGAVTERVAGLLYRTLDISSSPWLSIPLKDPGSEAESGAGS